MSSHRRDLAILKSVDINLTSNTKRPAERMAKNTAARLAADDAVVPKASMPIPERTRVQNSAARERVKVCPIVMNVSDSTKSVRSPGMNVANIENAVKVSPSRVAEAVNRVSRTSRGSDETSGHASQSIAA